MPWCKLAHRAILARFSSVRSFQSLSQSTLDFLFIGRWKLFADSLARHRRIRKVFKYRRKTDEDLPSAGNNSRGQRI
jgi:hypothetical protein